MGKFTRLGVVDDFRTLKWVNLLIILRNGWTMSKTVLINNKFQKKWEFFIGFGEDDSGCEVDYFLIFSVY